MVSRYFTNPYGFISSIGESPTRVIEVRHDDRKLSHCVDGTVHEGRFASSASESALERCLRAVAKGTWVELTYGEAFPESVPETRVELVW